MAAVRRLALLVTGCFALSWSGLVASGLHPVVPISFIFLILLRIPSAYGLSLTARVRRGRYLPLLGLLLGCMLLALYIPLHPLMILLDLLLLIPLGVELRSGRNDGSSLAILAGVLLLCVGYGAIWNSNYLALHFLAWRTVDPPIRALDEAVYGWMAGRPVDYVGFFPLVSSPTAFAVLEHAYVLAFTEIVACVFLLASDRERLREYIRRLLACYAIGLAVFLAWPIAGPYLYFPTSIGQNFSATQTYQFQQAGYREFASIRAGGQPITGFGYFVGLPSLHAAIAVLVLITARSSPVTFWMLLPVNVAMIASTVLLGYHYWLDTAAGLALAPLSCYRPGWPWAAKLGLRRQSPGGS